MKENSIFAVYFAKVFFINALCSSYLYGYTTAYICKDKEAIKSPWLLHSCCNCTLASMGGDSLSYFKFSFTMPKYKENQFTAKRSNGKKTPNGAKSECRIISINSFPRYPSYEEIQKQQNDASWLVYEVSATSLREILRFANLTEWERDRTTSFLNHLETAINRLK